MRWRHASAVKRHPTSPGEVMIPEAFTLNELLGEDVPSTKENSGSNGLRQGGMRCELALVPTYKSAPSQVNS